MVVSALEKAGILIEALPYIREFYGKTVVIKYGGAAMGDAALRNAVMQDLVLMKFVGMNPIVVHGGGPEITNMLKRLGIESRFVDGLRITDEASMEIVEMVLVGKINTDIVSGISSIGGKAIGLSGRDGGLIEAVKRISDVDLGCVGEVARVNPTVLDPIIANGYIPVIAPIGSGADRDSYNINADTVAGAIATAVKADKLVLLTDVPGIMQDPKDPDTLISTLKMSDVPMLIGNKTIAGGMIPKVECCIEALKAGVSRTHIIDGRVPHSILLEVFTDEGVGTMVVNG